MEKKPIPKKKPLLKRIIIYLVLGLWPYVLVFLYLFLGVPKEAKLVCIGSGEGTACAMGYVCVSIKVVFPIIAAIMLIIGIFSYIISRQNQVLRVIAAEFALSMLIGFVFGIAFPLLFANWMTPLGSTC
jgi:hypothetical protein